MVGDMVPAPCGVTCGCACEWNTGWGDPNGPVVPVGDGVGLNKKCGDKCGENSNEVVGVGQTEGDVSGPLTLVLIDGVGLNTGSVGCGFILVVGCKSSCELRVVVGLTLTVGDTEGEVLLLGCGVNDGTGDAPGV